MAETYRVWLNTSTESNGDRRERARYKAENIDEVVEAVKEDLFDELPEELEERRDIEEEATLSWTEEHNHEEGTSYKTYTYEIVKDNSKEFPLELITGQTPGRDLTN